MPRARKRPDDLPAWFVAYARALSDDDLADYRASRDAARVALLERARAPGARAARGRPDDGRAIAAWRWYTEALARPSVRAGATWRTHARARRVTARLLGLRGVDAERDVRRLIARFLGADNGPALRARNGASLPRASVRAMVGPLREPDEQAEAAARVSRLAIERPSARTGRPQRSALDAARIVARVLGLRGRESLAVARRMIAYGQR